MDLCRSFSLRAVLFMFLVGLATASTFISDAVFQYHGSTGRSLLQTKKGCPVDFEFQNYTTLKSKCKGPLFPANLCCAALTEFACPFADELNDDTNNCASTMFTYINQQGHYPPGLFASECHGDQQGLPCPPTPSKAQDDNANAGDINRSLTSLIIFIAGMVLACLFS